MCESLHRRIHSTRGKAFSTELTNQVKLKSAKLICLCRKYNMFKDTRASRFFNALSFLLPSSLLHIPLPLPWKPFPHLLLHLPLTNTYFSGLQIEPVSSQLTSPERPGPQLILHATAPHLKAALLSGPLNGESQAATPLCSLHWELMEWLHLGQGPPYDCWVAKT